MLPDDVLPLLTAAVDGELTPAEAATVRALLAGSPEARAAYRKLRADRQRLRQLAPATPPADLHARIMARLPARPPVPAEIVRSTPLPRRGSLVPVGMAASVLLALAGGSFWFFVNQPHAGPGANPAVVAHANRNRDADLTRLLPRDTVPPPSAPTVAEAPAPDVRVAVEPVVFPEVAPAPRAVERDVLTFPPLPDVGKLDLARVRVPFLATVAEFDREDVQQLFVAELGHDPAFRIDLFAHDAGRGAELLQAAAKGIGLTVHADKLTTERVQRKWATAYLVYTDSLAATDLRDLLTKLAAADAKTPERTFDAVHASPATPADQRELREVMGTDPGLWKRPGATTAEPKSVSSGTAERVAQALTDPTGKGGGQVGPVDDLRPEPVPHPAGGVPGTPAVLRPPRRPPPDRRPRAHRHPASRWLIWD